MERYEWKRQENLFVQAFHGLPGFLKEHSLCVGIYAGKLAKKLYTEKGYPKEILLNEDFLLMIENCATWHDIGKRCISLQIWEKPGPLTAAEKTLIRLHPLCGIYLVEGMITLKKETGDSYPFEAMFYDCCVYHHERWDGGGYPFGLKGYEIPLVARITALADAWDAMISDRPYRRGRGWEEALRDIQENAGTQFDPVLAEAFVSLIRAELAEQGTIME